MYGLDKTSRAITFTYHWDETVTDEEGNETQVRRDGTHQIRVGIVYDNLAYCLVDDKPVVYRVAFANVNDWYDATAEDVANRNIYTKRVVTIKTITFETTFKTFKYELDSTTTLNAVKLNGKSIDVATFQALYTQFASFVYSERNTAPGNTAEMTVRVELLDGTTDVIKFVPYNSRRYEAIVNGDGGVLISYELVDAMLESLKNSDKGSL